MAHRRGRKFGRKRLLQQHLTVPTIFNMCGDNVSRQGRTREILSDSFM
jgi:hypothetical protein